MPYNVDFQEIKKAITLEQAASWLHLTLKPEGPTLRGVCPINNGEKRELVLTPSKQLFNCFGCKAGGDVIAMVAHIKGMRMREAASELHDAFMTPAPAKAPQKAQEAPQAASEGFDPQKVIARLSYEHEAVQQMGFDPTTAKSLCIGFESKGLMKGKVAFALRDSSGRIVAFMGLDVGTQIKLPKTIL